MSHPTAFFGASTILGKYWTKRRKFDYLVNKENFKSTFGKSFRSIVFMDNAVANGPQASRANVEEDTRLTDYLISHLADIRPEHTVFVTTCDMLGPEADENTPTIKSSDDPYVQNRINMYEAVNRQYGRVLNVHLPEIASRDAAFSSLLGTLCLLEKAPEVLDFAPGEQHQLYFPERIMGDVERCIPLGIPAIIPAAPPLTTAEIVDIIAPEIAGRLRAPQEGDPAGCNRKSIHSFQWLDPKDGYLVSKDDQVELLRFFFRPDLAL